MGRWSKIFVVALLVFSSIGGSARHGQAAILAADSFEAYTAGATLNGNTGGSGFAGAYTIGNSITDPFPNLASRVTVVDKNLSYSSGSVFVDGGSKAVEIAGAANSNALIARSLANPATGGPIYFSFLYQTSSTTEAFLQFGLHNSLTSEPNASIGVQGNSGGGLGDEAFFARIGGTNTYGSAIAADTTYFVVGKISAVSSSNYNRVELFFNPSSDIEGTPTLTANGTGSLSAFDSFVVRTARTDAGNFYYFDALTIGNTFADVVPIPEPATWVVLLSLPVLALVRIRRQRSVV